MKGEGVSCPDLGSYRACSMWRYDESDNVYYPVWSPNDLPESESDLSTYARFTFPNGKVCDGYVVGVKRVFSIGLFGAGTMFFFNQNLPDLSAKQATMFLEKVGGLEIYNVQDLFPLTYRTNVSQEGFLEVDGVFNMSGLAGYI